MKCECCGDEFVIVQGRGMHKRILCYTCQPVGGDRKNTYRNKHMKRSYGITLYEYNEIYKSQNGCCKLCEAPVDFTGSDLRDGNKRERREPCLDHCHTSGKVRGILCFHCNTALGHVNDDISLLEKMVEYLKEANVNSPAN